MKHFIYILAMVCSLNPLIALADEEKEVIFESNQRRYFQVLPEGRCNDFFLDIKPDWTSPEGLHCDLFIDHEDGSSGSMFRIDRSCHFYYRSSKEANTYSPIKKGQFSILNPYTAPKRKIKIKIDFVGC